MIQTFQFDNITVAVARIEECERVQLSDSQQRDVDSLSIEKRRRERKACYWLINNFFSADTLIVHHSDGAPMLVDRNGNPLAEISFSLSHSLEYAAIAFSKSVQPLGVDIEQPSAKIRRVASKFLSERELADFADDTKLLAAWTAKEAAYKLARIPGLPLIEGISLRLITTASPLLWDITINQNVTHPLDSIALPSAPTTATFATAVTHQLPDGTCITLAKQ